jgi:phosphoesterase RecJ-like protein
MIVRQETPLRCTVGLRSRDALDVSRIAEKYGGGGHKNAAGLSIDGLIDDVLPKLLAEFEDCFAL